MPAPRHQTVVDRYEEAIVDWSTGSFASLFPKLSAAGAARNAGTELHDHRSSLQELEERLGQLDDRKRRRAA